LISEAPVFGFSPNSGNCSVTRCSKSGSNCNPFLTAEAAEAAEEKRGYFLISSATVWSDETKPLSLKSNKLFLGGLGGQSLTGIGRRNLPGNPRRTK
jgi:hypothetical protein